MKKFIAPISLSLLRKTKDDKKVSINLNTYRNLHHMIEGQCKRAFTDYMSDQLNGIVFENKIKVTYTVFYQRGGRHDKGNVISIIQKYFLDCLSYYGCIPDDNDQFIGDEIQRYGGVDKKNPRCEIVVEYTDT